MPQRTLDGTVPVRASKRPKQDYPGNYLSVGPSDAPLLDDYGRIWNEPMQQGLSRIPDGSVDLVLMDPPYEMDSTKGAGAFGSSKRRVYDEIEPISHGITDEDLDMIYGKQDRVNTYVFASKKQLRQLLDYFDDRGANVDLLTWHKTNPTPTCNNKYLSDTEYIVYARDPGVPLYGEYRTKRKWFETATNKADKDLYGHPTAKPVPIVRTLIENSTRPGQTVMDPFMGSGTTAEAAIQSGRRFTGFELDSGYYDTAVKRIGRAQGFPMRSDARKRRSKKARAKGRLSLKGRRHRWRSASRGSTRSGTAIRSLESSPP